MLSYDELSVVDSAVVLWAVYPDLERTILVFSSSSNSGKENDDCC